MQTICRLADFEPPSVSLYLFDDSTQVTVGTRKTYVGDPDHPDFVIGDCDIYNCILYEGVEDPDEWEAWKYEYTPDEPEEETKEPIE